MAGFYLHLPPSPYTSSHAKMYHIVHQSEGPKLSVKDINKMCRCEMFYRSSQLGRNFDLSFRGPLQSLPMLHSFRMKGFFPTNVIT